MVGTIIIMSQRSATSVSEQEGIAGKANHMLLGNLERKSQQANLRAQGTDRERTPLAMAVAKKATTRLIVQKQTDKKEGENTSNHD